MGTRPLNKTSSDTREICNSGILDGVPGRDGRSVPALGRDSRPQRTQATPHRKAAGPAQRTDSHFVLGTLHLENIIDSVAQAAKQEERRDSITYSIYVYCPYALSKEALGNRFH